MLKIKVCGMREILNVEELITISPDFIGFIFYEKSPRNIGDTIIDTIPFSIKKVGVFVDETESFILDKIDVYNLGYIQLHGDESPHFCKKIKALNRKVIKAFRIHENFNFSMLKEYEECCDYFLFDTFGKKPGGNGIAFNWSLLKKYKGEIPFLLSGGIDNGMTKEINRIDHAKFIGVDINSKFEIEPGIKNIEKIKIFKDELQHR